MKYLYVESSAILSWLFSEEKAEEVRYTINSAEVVFSSLLTSLEVSRAIIRAEATAQVSKDEAINAKSHYLEATQGWHFLRLTDRVLHLSPRRFLVELVRSLDALHLASIGELALEYSPLFVLSYDERIVDNLDGVGGRGF